MVGVNELCAKECSDKREPYKTYKSIWTDHDTCKGGCLPPKNVARITFNVGGAAVLLTMGVLFLARASSGCAEGVCTAYAWVFYLLALTMFMADVADAVKSLGVRVAFIMSATFSIFSQGLGEFRASMTEEKPRRTISRRLGIPASLIGLEAASEQETEELAPRTDES